MPRATIALPELKLCMSPCCSNIATGYLGYCFEHDRSRPLRNYSSSPLPRRNVKNPMGVEIECFNPENRSKVTHVAEYVCQDGSLPSGGGEIKLCSPESKLEDIAADTVQRSRIVGNQTNESCGLHVHMKIQQLQGYDVRTRLFKFVKNIEEFMFDIVPQSRKHNHYCSRLSEVYDLENHHSWISTSHRYPTLEVRIHAGTMNPWKVKGWINAWKQIRPDIDRIASGEEGWEDILSSYKKDGVLSRLKQDSIGYKYIYARKANNGKLTSFGFDTGLATQARTHGLEDREIVIQNRRLVDWLLAKQLSEREFNELSISEQDGIISWRYPSDMLVKLKSSIIRVIESSNMNSDVNIRDNSEKAQAYFPRNPVTCMLFLYNNNVYVYYANTWYKLKDNLKTHRDLGL